MINEHKRQKKLERKRKRREDKRRALTMEPSPPLHLPLVIRLEPTKLSVALKKVAEPLLEALPGRRRRREVLRVMRLAMLAWNAAVSLAPEDTGRELDEVSRRIYRDPQAAREIVLPMLQLLVERKRQLFPHDDRLVIDVEVLEVKDEFRIVAVSRQQPQ